MTITFYVLKLFERKENITRFCKLAIHHPKHLELYMDFIDKKASGQTFSLSP
jgi:hypothetical protein